MTVIAATSDMEKVSPEWGYESAGSLHVKPARRLGSAPTSSSMHTAPTVDKQKLILVLLSTRL